MIFWFLLSKYFALFTMLIDLYWHLSLPFSKDCRPVYYVDSLHQDKQPVAVSPLIEGQSILYTVMYTTMSIELIEMNGTGKCTCMYTAGYYHNLFYRL